MEAGIRDWRAAAAIVSTSAADVSMAVTRIITLSSYSLLIGVVVYLLEKGGDTMQRLIRVLCVCAALVGVLALGGIREVHADATRGSGAAVASTPGPMGSLGLTDDQKAQIRSILANYKPTLHPMMQQYRAGKQQLRRLIHATPVDDGAIRAQVAALSSIGADLAVQRAHLIQDVRGILTPDQIQKLTQTDDDIVGVRIDRLLHRLARGGAKN